MADSPILTAEEVQRMWPRDENDVDCATAGDTAAICGSHEALRAERDALADGGVPRWRYDEMCERVRTVAAERDAAQREQVDPSKVAGISDALHTMIEWYFDVPVDVRKRWVGMPSVVQGFIDEFGPWVERAPWEPDRFRDAMASVGWEGENDFTEEALRAEVHRERRRGDAVVRLLERAEAERDAALAALRALAALVASQAEDDGIWFMATFTSEAYLQQELRTLHEAVETAARAVLDATR